MPLTAIKLPNVTWCNLQVINFTQLATLVVLTTVEVMKLPTNLTLPCSASLHWHFRLLEYSALLNAIKDIPKNSNLRNSLGAKDETNHFEISASPPSLLCQGTRLNVGVIWRRKTIFNDPARDWPPVTSGSNHLPPSFLSPAAVYVHALTPWSYKFVPINWKYFIGQNGKQPWRNG